MADSKLQLIQFEWQPFVFRSRSQHPLALPEFTDFASKRGDLWKARDTREAWVLFGVLRFPNSGRLRREHVRLRACFFGFVCNAMVVRTAHKHKKTYLKEEFYRYMSVISKFNCIYCLIFVFYPINVCNNYNSDFFFCPGFYTNYVAQYYKIIFVAYLGESLKMWPNILYLLMTVNRYMLIGKLSIKRYLPANKRV